MGISWSSFIFYCIFVTNSGKGPIRKYDHKVRPSDFHSFSSFFRFLVHILILFCDRLKGNYHGKDGFSTHLSLYMVMR